MDVSILFVIGAILMIFVMMFGAIKLAS